MDGVEIGSVRRRRLLWIQPSRAALAVGARRWRLDSAPQDRGAARACRMRGRQTGIRPRRTPAPGKAGDCLNPVTGSGRRGGAVGARRGTRVMALPTALFAGAQPGPRRAAPAIGATAAGAPPRRLIGDHATGHLDEPGVIRQRIDPAAPAVPRIAKQDPRARQPQDVDAEDDQGEPGPGRLWRVDAAGSARPTWPAYSATATDSST